MTPLSSMPDWLLTPVRHVRPGNDTEFPRLFQPASDETTDLSQFLLRHRAELDDALSRHGAVLLRGFAITGEADFERAAAALTSSLEGSYGDLVKRDSAEYVYDATRYPHDRAILFHNEGSHTPRLPTRQLFFCARDGFTEGETPIVDCRRVWRDMRPRLRELFERRKLLYIRNFIRGVDVSWQDFFRTSNRENVERRCHEQGLLWTWKHDGTLRISMHAPAVLRHPHKGEASFCNQIMLHHVACLDEKTGAALRMLYGPTDLPRNVCFGDGSPIPDELIAELLTLTVRTAVRFAWQRGDILLLDNLLVAHARSPFRGEREILVAIGDVIARSEVREGSVPLHNTV